MEKTVKLTETQQWVLDFLKVRRVITDDYISPTDIGKAYKDGCHSAWASPRCLQLTIRGLLERNKQGHYRYKV